MIPSFTYSSLGCMPDISKETAWRVLDNGCHLEEAMVLFNYPKEKIIKMLNGDAAELMRIVLSHSAYNFLAFNNHIDTTKIFNMRSKSFDASLNIENDLGRMNERGYRFINNDWEVCY